MELPEHLKFKAILVQGGAFKAQLPTDAYPRYYIVLNKDPEDDDKIILITSTTHFELHRNCPGGDDVHILLSSADFEEFTKECLICCNRPIDVDKGKLKVVLNKQQYTVLKPVPNPVVQKILNGILKSSVVESRIKKLVLPDDE